MPLVDDWQVGFTHLGSPGWMLQRPESEKAAVYDLMPEMTGLIEIVDGNPYRREAAIARTHIEALFAVLGLGRKKCVIVDLDDTLWPGVLAETGAPSRGSQRSAACSPSSVFISACMRRCCA